MQLKTFAMPKKGGKGAGRAKVASRGVAPSHVEPGSPAGEDMEAMEAFRVSKCRGGLLFFLAVGRLWQNHLLCGAKCPKHTYIGIYTYTYIYVYM